MSNVSLMPVPAQQPASTCANCGAALVADQHYCLSCGKPASPVRLGFLDVLQSEQSRPAGAPPPAWAVPGTIELGPGGYLPVQAQPGVNGWLRRNSGLLGLLAVLLMCLFIGLLVGHWASQSKASGPQVYKIEGLGVLGAGTAAGASTTPTTGTTGAATTSGKAAKSQEAKEAAEGEKETKAEKALPTKAKAVTPTTVEKVAGTHGKKHQEEIEALAGSGEPIEVK